MHKVDPRITHMYWQQQGIPEQLQEEVAELRQDILPRQRFGGAKSYKLAAVLVEFAQGLEEVPGVYAGSGLGPVKNRKINADSEKRLVR